MIDYFYFLSNKKKQFEKTITRSLFASSM